MANIFLALLPFLCLCLVSGTKATHLFSNAYIQNVKSGKCITIGKDVERGELSSSNCDCGPYQFWKLGAAGRVVNELARHGYMDQVGGKPQNGAPIGISNRPATYQKFNVNKRADGNYKFVLQHNGKCLHQGESGKIVQYDCHDGYPAQKWKIVENPCGKLPKLPAGHFQLQNPVTGKCAVVKGNSDGGWAQVVTHNCDCGNNHQYWRLKGKQIVTEGKSKQCLANWASAAGPRLNHPGVTQCVCTDEAIHRWRLAPLGDDGTFNLITVVDGKCVFAHGPDNTLLRYKNCARGDVEQKWRFHDACHPGPPPTPKPAPPKPAPPTAPPPQLTNVIPEYLVSFFDNGMMSWLSPTRYTLLVGGRWDQSTLTWYTVDGRQIQPNTDMWTVYFGDAQPSFLSVLFPGGKTWNQVFGWMTIDFFQTWTSWKPAPNPAPTPPPQPINVIPNYMVTFFNNGHMNWLTPERYSLLVGGRWEPTALTWFTIDGRQIRPSTPDWTIYFGNLQPSDLTVFFPSGGSWNEVFGWMTPAFFQTWTGWQTVQIPYQIPIVISGYIPTATSQLFASGQVNWLTPDRVKMLSGGQWTGTDYVTKAQVHVAPGTPTWTEYFGSATTTDLNTLFGGPGSWDVNFPWLNNAVKDVPAGIVQGSFSWDNFFRQK